MLVEYPLRPTWNQLDLIEEILVDLEAHAPAIRSLTDRTDLAIVRIFEHYHVHWPPRLDVPRSAMQRLDSLGFDFSYVPHASGPEHTDSYPGA
ncbi:MAG: hypothetical protein AAF726_09965 [Planctomycetota bacterium]